MCFTIDQLDRACGILLLSESNTFIYCCKRCSNEFATGPELESHILYEYYGDNGDEKKPLESIFVSDDAYSLSQADNVLLSEHQTESNNTTFDQIHIQTDVKEFSSDTIEPNAVVKTEATRKSKRTRTELSRRSKTQRKIVGTTENNSQISTHKAPTSKHPDFIDTDETSLKVEKSQNQSLNIRINERALNEMQNEAISMDKPFQDNSDSGDNDNASEVHMNEPSNLKNSASPKKSPAKKRKSLWKPKKGIFYCDMCPGVTFSTLEILKAHMKRHSLNTLRKPCSLCSIRPRNMEKHMRIAHIEAKPYKCDFCDETFRHNYGRVSTVRMRLLSCQQFISNFMFCSQILLSHLGSSYAIAYWRTTIPLCYMRKIIQNSRCAAETQYASA